MRVIAASLLAAAAVAVDVSDSYNHGHEHPDLNDHYDNHDTGHQHYGGDSAASPAYPAAPDFKQAVDAFDTYGTLFGEHRYQLQVAKTGNMLIGTEALRESISSLQYRVHHARTEVSQNDQGIDNNDQEIAWNRQQIAENRDRLYTLDGRVHDLETGYGDLHHKLAIDREALIMMCHQYAYASSIPHECEPIIGGLSAPLNYAWNWPQDDCSGSAALPPFPHPLPYYDNPHDHQEGYSADPHYH